MKELIRYGFILALICTLASGLLAGVNALTKSRILAQAQAEEEASLKEVLPQAEHFEPIKSGNDILYYKAHDKNGNLIGIVFKASGKGYSSVIETMAGMTKEGKITAIKVINQSETPGLGAGIAEKKFTTQFNGKNISELDDLQAITGATISSQAVIDAVKKRAQDLEGILKNEK